MHWLQAVGGNSALALLLTVGSNVVGIFTMPFVLCAILGASSAAVQLSPAPLLRYILSPPACTTISMAVMVRTPAKHLQRLKDLVVAISRQIAQVLRVCRECLCAGPCSRRYWPPLLVGAAARSFIPGALQGKIPASVCGHLLLAHCFAVLLLFAM